MQNPSRIAILVFGCLIGLALLLAACQAPARPVSAPPTTPATAAVAKLADEELAAQRAAAIARAAGDQVQADHQARLAAELGRLREHWTGVEADQRRALDAQQSRINDEAQRLAQAAQLAKDQRTAWMVAGIGGIVSLIAGVVFWRLGLPLWIPPLAAIGCLEYGAWWKAEGILVWILGGTAVLGVVGLLLYLVWMLYRAARSGATHGDVLESEVETALHNLGPDADELLADVRASIRSAIARAKSFSLANQLHSRLHHVVQAVRGKPVKG